MRKNGTNLTWTSHNPPSQQEPNIIPDEHHTTHPIWLPMFTGKIIQVTVTHRHLYILRSNKLIHLVPSYK